MIIRIADDFINLDNVTGIDVRCTAKDEWAVCIGFTSGEYTQIEPYFDKVEALEAIMNANKIEFTTAHQKTLEKETKTPGEYGTINFEQTK